MKNVPANGRILLDSISLLIVFSLALALLPLVVVWAVWKKTGWNSNGKWIATALVAIVFVMPIMMVSSASENDRKIKELEQQLEAERARNARPDSGYGLADPIADDSDRAEEENMQVGTGDSASAQSEQADSMAANEPSESPADSGGSEGSGSASSVSVASSSSSSSASKEKAVSSGKYACDCSKTCPNMSSCAEAQYQLKVCGCTRRDADHDGIACDADCQ